MDGKWDDMGATGNDCSIPSEGCMGNKTIETVPVKDLQQHFSIMVGRLVKMYQISQSPLTPMNSGPSQ